MTDTASVGESKPEPISAPAEKKAASNKVSWDMTNYFKALAAFMLGGSVFYFAMSGKISVETYIGLVVTPGLAAIGLHRS